MASNRYSQEVLLDGRHPHRDSRLYGNPAYDDDDVAPDYDDGPQPLNHHPNEISPDYDNSPPRRRPNRPESPVDIHSVHSAYYDEPDYDDAIWNAAAAANHPHLPSTKHRYYRSNSRAPIMPDNIHLPSRMHAHDTVHRTLGRRLAKKYKDIDPNIQSDLQDPDNVVRFMETDIDVGDRKDDDLTRLKEIKDMNVNLTKKKSLKAKLDEQKPSEKIGCFKAWKYGVAMGLHRTRQSWKNSIKSLEFWTSHLKVIEGNFGTGVMSYFRFHRWLFLLNLPVFILSVSFLVIPQMLYRWLQQDPRGYAISNKTFLGDGLLTGTNFFEDTELFYGYYFNGTINVIGNLYYDMPFAYLGTCGGYYLLCAVILCVSFVKSYREGEAKQHGDLSFHFIQKVFSGWDYAISNDATAELKHRSLYLELSEMLSSQHAKRKMSCAKGCSTFMLRLVCHFLIFVLIAGCSFLIWYIGTEKALKSDVRMIKYLAMPICFTSINMILPYAFSFMANFEDYVKTQTKLYVTMFRMFLLKTATLGVLIYVWYDFYACIEISSRSADCMTEMPPCWETFIGQELYRLVVVDFIFCLFEPLFTELIPRLCSLCCKRLPRPEFGIAQNTINIIYAQALCWFGQYFCPPLAFIQLIKLFVLFYVKRISVVMNCAPSSQPWRAARAHTVFLALSLFMYLGMCISLAVSFVYITPSSTCGPYRGLDTVYALVYNKIDVWKRDIPGLGGVVTFLSSAGFVFFIIVFLLTGIYYLRVLAKAHDETVNKLKHHLVMAGRDKSFLLNKYKEVIKDIPEDLPDDYDLSPGTSNENGRGRQFSKASAGAVSHKISTTSLASPSRTTSVQSEIPEEPNNRQNGVRKRGSTSVPDFFHNGKRDDPVMYANPVLQNNNRKISEPVYNRSNPVNYKNVGPNNPSANQNTRMPLVGDPPRRPLLPEESKWDNMSYPNARPGLDNLQYQNLPHLQQGTRRNESPLRQNQRRY